MIESYVTAWVNQGGVAPASRHRNRAPTIYEYNYTNDLFIFGIIQPMVNKPVSCYCNVVGLYTLLNAYTSTAH